MTQPKHLPDLFGRFTAIFQDHEHLALTLQRLRRMCAALEAGQASIAEDLRPQALLAQLRADLSEHFDSEESPAYFGVVLSEAPALARQVAGLKWEHLSMLRSVNALCELSLEPARWNELPSGTRCLIEQLERHEKSESELLRGLFRS
jgi:hypothetical protein